MEKVRGWLRRFPIAAVAGALIVGGLFGAAAAGSSDDGLNAKVSELKGKLSRADGRLAELGAARDRIAAKQARLDRREARLDQRAKKLTQSEQVVERNSIEDGIWEVGKDIEPGTYRAKGGGHCYWALLGSADTSDIVNNGGFGPNQTVTIDSPWFETSDCGTWEKIG